MVREGPPGQGGRCMQPPIRRRL